MSEERRLGWEERLAPSGGPGVGGADGYTLAAMFNGSTAYYHFVHPHALLRVALAQPRERGGKLVAQCYRQPTPAMAAGKTNRRWAAREVLCHPLSPMPSISM
jgi:hypothetical protein